MIPSDLHITLEIDGTKTREEYLIYVGKRLIASEFSSESEDLFAWQDRVEAARYLIAKAGGTIRDYRVPTGAKPRTIRSQSNRS